MNRAAHAQSRQPTAGLVLVALAALALCAFYGYAYVGLVPAPGVNLLGDSWEVVDVDPAVADRDSIRVGDTLLRIGDLTRAAYARDPRSVPFGGTHQGDHITLVRQRAGAVSEIDWVMPPLSRATLNARIALTLPAVLFYLIGLVSHAALRPRSREWLLVVSCSYLLAAWLMVGIVSGSGFAGSSLVLHAVTWLLAATLIDLHLTFPRSLWPSRSRLGRAALFGLAGVAAGLELLAGLPRWANQIALLLGLAVSLALLLYHLVSRASPPHRAAATLMLSGIGLGLGPGVILAVVPSLLGQSSNSLALFYLSLFAVPLLPLFYTYAIYKRHLGSLEFRATRVIAVYLFLLVMLLVLAVAASALGPYLAADPQSAAAGLILAGGLLTVLGTIFGFAPFQRLVERYVLGIPPAPTHLVVTYASRIATCLELPSLVRLLQTEVLPGLLVRQSALLSPEAAGTWRVLYTSGLTPEQLPAAADPAAAWVRLALPLRAAGLPGGWWLLGRRDPDDAYAATEVPVLQALADQLAVALVNIRQAAHLHALYQANVDRAESERLSLARELHDGPLNAFGLLAQKVEGERIAPDFQTTYASAVGGLRQSIAGLRPVTLNYGLPVGLRSLVSDLGDQWPTGPELTLAVAEAGCRYPPQVETHAYRIMQQACLNALRHAGARTIRLHGVLEPERLDLTVEDDGRGFVAGADLTAWLAQHHFGLAGMHERATLIGGGLQIHSAPGAGTRVRLIWPAPSA